MSDLTIITTHFHEFRWIETWHRHILANTPAEAIREIIVVDQDRTEESRSRLSSLDPRFRVRQFARSEPHFRAVGHDHGAVLNAVVREAQGSIVCLFDSDAYPLNPAWWPRSREMLASQDALLAACHDAPDLSHPCFMVFRREWTAIPLRFDDGLFEKGVDTGRRIASHMRQAGARVALLQPTVGFSGKWGSVYLGSIYHHGSGSFHGSDPMVRAQLTWLHRYFTHKVLNGDGYTLSAAEKFIVRVVYFVLYGARIRARRIWNRPCPDPRKRKPVSGDGQ